MKKISLLAFAITLATICQAQDARMSQFWVNSMRMNPGLISKGLDKGQSRITSGYRNQWSILQIPFNSMSLAFEKPLAGESSSMGLLINRDIAGSGRYQNLSINGVYGYQIDLGANSLAQFGLQLAYQHSSLDRSDMRFLDGIDPILGYLGSQDAVPFAYKGYINTALGGSLQGKFGEIGIAIHNINQPKYSFYSNSDNIVPRKYTAHAALHIGSNGPMQLHPTVVAMKQGEFSDLSAGLSYQLQGFNLHGYYRKSFLNQGNVDALSFGVGISANGLQLGYSYDLTLSALKNEMPSSHEVSVRINLGMSNERTAIGGKTKSEKESNLYPVDQMVEASSLADMKRISINHDPAKLKLLPLGEYTATPGYYMSVGLSKTEEGADEQIISLLAQDVKAFKMRDPNTGVYYLFVEYYDSENEAREALLDLEQSMSRVWIREVN